MKKQNKFKRGDLVKFPLKENKYNLPYGIFNVDRVHDLEFLLSTLSYREYFQIEKEEYIVSYIIEPTRYMNLQNEFEQQYLIYEDSDEVTLCSETEAQKVKEILDNYYALKTLKFQQEEKQKEEMLEDEKRKEKWYNNNPIPEEKYYDCYGREAIKPKDDFFTARASDIYL